MSMTQVIIYSTENGNVAVCYPTGELPIEEVLVKDCPSGAIIVNNDILPHEHNDFFDAWELVNDAILVNIGKAKEITKTRLRAEREPLLQAQDVAFQRALETGTDTTVIVAEKQRLRDITTLADAATTLEELRAIKV
jgi:hypothetical protein